MSRIRKSYLDSQKHKKSFLGKKNRPFSGMTMQRRTQNLHSQSILPQEPVQEQSLRWYIQPTDLRQEHLNNDLASSYEHMTLSAVRMLSKTMMRQAHNNKLSTNTHLERTLSRCLHTLSEDLDTGEILRKLLAIIGTYYQADRVRLYELDAHKKIHGDPHEWVSIPENPTFSGFRMNSEETALLVNILKSHGQYIISDIDKELDHTYYVYKSLKERNVRNLILVPIFSKKKVIAFIDVENAQVEQQNPMLLHSLTFFMRENLKHLLLSAKLECSNYTDSVTNLYNREKYRERLDVLDLAPLETMGILRLDVNGLKSINALYGEDYGNYVLSQTGNLLRKHAPSEDIFRMGNGEFLALLPNISRQEFNTIVNAIRTHEAAIDEYSVAVGAIWQWQEVDIQLAIADAGEIMMAEKQKYYKDLPHNHVHRRLHPAAIVLDEIDQGLFSIYLQPKVELSSGQIIGAEALIRKKQKNGKMVPPTKFIPTYEHDGTVRHVDFFVLEAVCKLLQKLIQKGAAINIAVNFSRVTLLSFDVRAEMEKICAKYNVPHEYIKIEITESIEKLDFNFFEQKLRNLHHAGFGVSLDDFGAKQSNLAMLTIPYFSEVKIDKVLLDNMDADHKNHIIVKHIINMVQDLETSACIVEGIETEEQRQKLMALGCKYGQGYLFHRPVPVDEFMHKLGLKVKEC